MKKEKQAREDGEHFATIIIKYKLNKLKYIYDK